ncbi:MAG: NUDIX domain-containing protein [Candidatus Omnitrophota bacterium]
MKIKDTDIKIIQSGMTQAATEAIVVSDKRQNELSPPSPSRLITVADIMNKDRLSLEERIRQATAAALQTAQEQKMKSIGFPSLGCPDPKVPARASAKIMTQEIIKYLRTNEATLKEIIFYVNDEELFRVFDKTIKGYVVHLLDPFARPYCTVDAIIEYQNGIILIERSNPPFGWALPGGFADYGESLEDAVKREAKEETNLDLLGLKQFHTYSQPDRDERFHTVSTVFVAQGQGEAKSGDDAQNLKIVAFDDLKKMDYAFDHRKIIEDYLESKTPHHF